LESREEEVSAREKNPSFFRSKMAWRFKASKFKNAAPKTPKFEHLIRDLSIGSYMSHGNCIAASAAYMAFNWDTSGSNLAVLPLDTKGRQNKTSVPLIYAHPDFVTDFQFSPFDDGLLATGSLDTTIKIWRIPERGMPVGGLHKAELTLESQPRRIEGIAFNPSADGVMASTSGTKLAVWDLFEGKEMFSFDGHDDDVQSFCWQPSGRLLATQSRDRQLRIVDPRAVADNQLPLSCDSHQGLKDSKVVWLSDGNRLLTSGFGADRCRELFIRDIRNLSEPQKQLTLDASAGILVPLYDPDTEMCFLAGKGDGYIQFVEVTNSDPFIAEAPVRYNGGDLTKGACLVPKRAMDVMQGEVNRLLQLSGSSVVPVTWQVPRKSYRDYHADIYPETNGYTAMMGPDEWSRGDDTPVPKINLDPKKRPKEVLTVYQSGPLSAKRKRDFAANSSRKSSISSDCQMSPSGGELSSSEQSSPTSSSSAASKPMSVGNNSDNQTKEMVQPNEDAAFAIADSTFVKPSPRPRTKVSRVTSNGASEQSDDSMDSPKPKRLLDSPFLSANKPQPQPRPPQLSSKPSPQLPPKPRLSSSQSVDVAPSPPPTPSSMQQDMPTQPKQENGSSNNGNESNVDEGLAMLRRQPSIRDRKKLFEESMKRNQSESGNNGGGAPPPVARKSSVGSVFNRLISNESSNGGGGGKPIAEEDASGGAATAPVLRRKKTFQLPDAAAAAADQPERKPSRPVSKMFGRLSKFKHLKGDVMLKGKFDNLRNLSRTVPAESNFFHANPDRLAVPLTGQGGKISILETKRPGRIPAGIQPALIHGSTVMDFGFDPFDNARLVSGCDDGSVNLWRIPEETGLTTQTNETELTFCAHNEKIQIVKFHPLAQNVLLSAAFDKTVKIWNLEDSSQPALELTGHTEQLFSAEWSPCGNFVATVCKDGKIRIFDPRSGSEPVKEGGEIVPKKGARIVWVLEGLYLIVTGFGKQSERQITMFRSSDLEKVACRELDVSPAILVPHYDEDSSTLFVTGKGESTVMAFEVAHDGAHLFELSSYKGSGLHQGFAFLPKIACNVREVEFARAYRITNTTIEPISFTVPRVRPAYFQDDLFPETKILWQPTLTSGEWLEGSRKQPRRLDLRPEDMRPLSESKQGGGGESQRAYTGAGGTNQRASIAKIEKENAPPPPHQDKTQGQQPVNPLMQEMARNNYVVNPNNDDWSD